MPNINPINISNGTPPTSGWQRPGDWLAMPTVVSTDQTFVGLYAIFPSGQNWCTFRFTTSSGQYEVDWGDGTTTLHNSNTNAEHEYDYSTYDTGNTTLSTRGYKQAIIVVTPVSGNLTGCNFQQIYTTTPSRSSENLAFLDCILSMPNANTGQSIIFGGGTVSHRYVERLEIKTIGNATSLSNLFDKCSSLQSIPLFDTSNVTNFISMIRDCSSLQSIPLFDTSNATSFLQFAQGCTSIQSIPHFDTSSATTMTTMLSACRSLRTIPPFDTSSITADFSGFALNCSQLCDIGLSFTHQVDIRFCTLSRGALVNIFVNLADRTSLSSANINITGNWGASALTSGERDIALNKNWTITG